MKRFIAMILVLSLVFAFAACGGTEVQNEEGTDNGGETTEETLAGGWTKADSPEITDEMRALFDKAQANLDGAEYVPIAFIARQVVAGTNYLFMTRCTIVTADPVEHYALVTVYEDPSGNAEITDIVGTGVETYMNGMMGGWQEAESPVVDEELNEAFTKAAENLVGVDYKPLAVLGTQVVAGMNYCILSEATVVAPDAQPEYALVYLYVDLDGNSEVTDVVNIVTDSEETAD